MAEKLYHELMQRCERLQRLVSIVWQISRDKECIHHDVLIPVRGLQCTKGQASHFLTWKEVSIRKVTRNFIAIQGKVSIFLILVYYVIVMHQHKYSLAIELIMMTLPLFCSRNIGKTARQQWKTPSVFVANMFRQSLSSKFSGNLTFPRIPAFATKMQRPPSSLSKENQSKLNCQRPQRFSEFLIIQVIAVCQRTSHADGWNQ